MTFTFRDRTHLILTIPRIYSYTMPSGLIKRDSEGKYLVKHNSNRLKFIENPSDLTPKTGVPEGFYIKKIN